MAFLSLVPLFVQHSSVPEVNFSTYRVTPITYPGVTNMDSGDAAGDVMFGEKRYRKKRGKDVNMNPFDLRGHRFA